MIRSEQKDKPCKAFERMIREYESSIYSICYMYSKSVEEAKDLMQETLINIWRGFPKFRGESSPATWINRITLNTCLSYKRKRKVNTIDESFIPPLQDTTPETGKQVAMLHSRLQKLDYFDRAIVLLWLENLSYDEIGEIVGITPKNVGVRLLRIKEKLKGDQK